MSLIQLPWAQAPVYQVGAGSLAEQLAEQRGLELFDEGVAYDPFLMKGMEEACEVLRKTIARHGRVLIHGDYDVDGLTATSILYHFLSRFGLDLLCHIPNRLVDGYGLAQEGVERAICEKVDLVITVDCGITSVAEVDQLIAAGIPVLVTDHHQCKATLPRANACIDPSRPDETYPFPKLCGAAVALKLVQAMCQRYGYETEVWESLLDLAALGTVADLMPLEEENRYLVLRGLERFQASLRPGLAALIAQLKLKEEEGIHAQTLGFLLAPRLNAAGRMGESETALRLLLTESPAEAEAMARRIEELNRRRKEEESRVTREAEEQVLREDVLRLCPVLLLSQADWHGGVLGISAMRMVQRFLRPAVVLSESEDGHLKGSARSYGEMDLLSIFRRHESLLQAYGGHHQAAGVELSSEAALRQWREALLVDGLEDPRLWPGMVPLGCDLVLTPEACTEEAIESLQALEPFGKGNENPIFQLSSVKLITLRSVGKEREHLSLVVQLADGRRMKCIAFFAADDLLWLRPGLEVDLLGSLRVESWQGVEELRWRVEDLRLATTLPSCETLPLSLVQNEKALLSFFASVYRLLEKLLQGSTRPLLLDPVWLGQALFDVLGGRPSAQLMETVLQVFMESAILLANRWPTGERDLWLCSLHPSTARSKLSDAPSFHRLLAAAQKGGRR